MLKIIWKFFNKYILFESILDIHTKLTIAKEVLVILIKNKDDLSKGIEVGYKNEKIARKFQDFLTPFGGKDYRLSAYHYIESSEESYNILRNNLPEETKNKFIEYDFDISNKKYFLEDTFQLFYLMWFYRNSKGIGAEYEILLKGARRCTYDLSHLGSVRVIEKNILDSFHTKYYENIFTVRGSLLQRLELKKFEDFLFEENTKLVDEYTKLGIDIPQGGNIIPF